jgi:hypothetical protein
VSPRCRKERTPAFLAAMATLRPTSKVSTNHKACIHHIAHDYYGKRVATCSSDKVWMLVCLLCMGGEGAYGSLHAAIISLQNLAACGRNRVSRCLKRTTMATGIPFANPSDTQVFQALLRVQCSTAAALLPPPLDPVLVRSACLCPVLCHSLSPLLPPKYPLCNGEMHTSLMRKTMQDTEQRYGKWIGHTQNSDK